jgi:hypothetical protein
MPEEGRRGTLDAVKLEVASRGFMMLSSVDWKEVLEGLRDRKGLGLATRLKSGYTNGIQ